MARTSQQNVKRLLCQARTILGAKTHADVWTFCIKAQHSLAQQLRLNNNSITISPYKGSTWAVSVLWGNKGLCQWLWIPTTFEIIADERTTLAKQVRRQIQEKTKLNYPINESELTDGEKAALDECRDSDGRLCPSAGQQGCEYGHGCYLSPGQA